MFSRALKKSRARDKRFYERTIAANYQIQFYQLRMKEIECVCVSADDHLSYT